MWMKRIEPKGVRALYCKLGVDLVVLFCYNDMFILGGLILLFERHTRKFVLDTNDRGVLGFD